MSSRDEMRDLPANLEVERALAGKLIFFDFKTADMWAVLTVTDSLVSKGKSKFENEGAAALKLNY